MHHTKKRTVRTALLAPILLTSVMSIFGVGIGTYCWFEYQSRTKVTYCGTAVSANGSLDIGLIANQRLINFDQKHHLFEDKTSLPGKYIYWTYEGESLSSNTILDYASNLGYASNKITATSSGKYQDGGVFNLKKAPAYMQNVETQHARPDTYTHLSVAMRSHSSAQIFLKNCSINCENNVREAVRIHFQDGTKIQTSFIYNPTSLEDGSEAVGGILNLNQFNDRFYDYDPAQQREHIYGECQNVTYDGSKYTKEDPIDPKLINSFVSNHQEGLFIPTITPEYCYYHGSHSVNNVKTLLTLSSEQIGQLEMDIYLEGWNHTCVEQSISSQYSLNLEFSYKGGSTNE